MPKEARKGPDSLVMALLEDLSCQTWFLGTELGPSGRVVILLATESWFYPQRRLLKSFHSCLLFIQDFFYNLEYISDQSRDKN